MANQWLRLWHEMPNDPKWRTIARFAGQPISHVLAVYLHLLVDASRNVTRGHATVTQEDLASALDVTEEAIGSILAAMQGRVLDGMRLLGWEKRQPKREDDGDETTGAKSAAQRKKDERERKRLAALAGDVTQSHDESRDVTLDKDKDTDKDPLTGGVGREPPTPMKAGAICRAMRQKGIADINPSNPVLLELIAKGVTPEMFEAAAETARDAVPPKGFAYALGIVKRQLGEAAVIASGAGMPSKPWDIDRPSIEAKGIELGLGPWNEADLRADRESFTAYTARVRRAVEALAGEPA